MACNMRCIYIYMYINVYKYFFLGGNLLDFSEIDVKFPEFSCKPGGLFSHKASATEAWSGPAEGPWTPGHCYFIRCHVSPKLG